LAELTALLPCRRSWVRVPSSALKGLQISRCGRQLGKRWLQRGCTSLTSRADLAVRPRDSRGAVGADGICPRDQIPCKSRDACLEGVWRATARGRGESSLLHSSQISAEGHRRALSVSSRGTDGTRTRDLRSDRCDRSVSSGFPIAAGSAKSSGLKQVRQPAPFRLIAPGRFQHVSRANVYRRPVIASPELVARGERFKRTRTARTRTVAAAPATVSASPPSDDALMPRSSTASATREQPSTSRSVRTRKATTARSYRARVRTSAAAKETSASTSRR
jgi:hypothetical protein